MRRKINIYHDGYTVVYYGGKYHRVIYIPVLDKYFPEIMSAESIEFNGFNLGVLRRLGSSCLLARIAFTGDLAVIGPYVSQPRSPEKESYLVEAFFNL